MNAITMANARERWRAARPAWRSSAIFALASLACLTLASSAAPAASKTCYQKFLACTDRCERNNDGVWAPCQRRTCNPQYNNCMSSAAGGSDRPGTGREPKGGKSGPIVRDKRNPPQRPRRADSTIPIIQPTPAVQPRPATTGSGGASPNPPVVRDHRPPNDGRARPFGIGVPRRTR